MAVTTQRQGQQFAPPVYRQPQPIALPRPTSSVPPVANKKRSKTGLMVAASLKASLIGGLGFLLLMGISLLPPAENFALSIMIPPLVFAGFIALCVATGLLASILAGDTIKNTQQGAKVGWMAGFWAGILGGIAAMLMAATSFYLVNFGLSVAEQVDQIGLGLPIKTIALAARVFGALIIYGIIGSLISALLSSFGGMLYAKLSAVE